MNLQIWAREQTQLAYGLWRADADRCPGGVKLFSGPVRHSPRFLVFGYNPGGGERNWVEEDSARFEAGDFAPPAAQEYAAKGYPIAQATRRLFGEQLDDISPFVKTNIYCVRTRTAADLPEGGWVDAFGRRYVRDAVERLDPKAILFEGFMTLNQVKKWFPADVVEDREVRAGRRVARGGRFLGLPFIAYIHPSGKSQPRQPAEYAAIRTAVANLVM